MIFLGADHKGFEIKEKVEAYLKEKTIEFMDCGAQELNPEDDYTDYAFQVSENVIKDSNNFGILICNSGEGMSIAANKVKGVRAALCNSEESCKKSREHNNANILVLNSDNDIDSVIKFIETFLNTPFSFEERHLRRIEKITQYENEHFK